MKTMKTWACFWTRNTETRHVFGRAMQEHEVADNKVGVPYF
jgi:hypothetical protein